MTDYAALKKRREEMETDALLPCPFCGNTEPYRRTQYDYIGPNEGLGSGGNVSRHYVNCGKCGAQHNAPNPDAGHWNLRPLPPAGGWRDMKDAPKDESCILGWDGFGVVIMSWCPADEIDIEQGITDGVWHAYSMQEEQFIETPIAWQPLPAPPASGKE